jgi:hypothetical protein
MGALFTNTTGTNNIAIGLNAGYNPTAGSNNIEIGNLGVAADTNTIRIGTQGMQTRTFIAGIVNGAVSGADVMVNGSGQLGVVVSSARYKRDINEMGSSTEGLMKLRPVTFRYKADPQAIKQYGLVAEEVDKVYPELVVRDDTGKVESVRYSMLTSMLLNELQKQTKKLRSQSTKNVQQAEKIEQLSRQVAEQKASTERLEMKSAQESARRVTLEERLAALEHTIVAQHRGFKVETSFNR